jgi:hypothetical protein
MCIASGEQLKMAQQLVDKSEKTSIGKHMNKLIIALLLAIAQCTGAKGQSALRISLTDKTPITISVDGRYFNTRGESVTVNDMPWGRHYVKIFTHAQGRDGRGAERVVFEGRVRTNRNQVTLFSYDAYSGRSVTSIEPLGTLASNQPQESFNKRNLDNYDRANDGNANGNNEANERPTAGDNPLPPDTPELRELPPGAPVASPVTMEPEESETTTATKKATQKKTTNSSSSVKDKTTTTKWTTLKEKVTSKKTDTEKFEVVSTGLVNEKFSTAKAAEVMDWFSFESTRLSFAMWAYSRLTDPSNAKQIGAKLENAANKKEYDAFLKNK